MLGYRIAQESHRLLVHAASQPVLEVVVVVVVDVVVVCVVLAGTVLVSYVTSG